MLWRFDRVYILKITMQNNERFGELHNVCFNEENYPYDIYQNLKPFRGISFWESNNNRLPINEIPNFLEYQNISDEVKQRFERNISPIQSKDFNGITTALFFNSFIGNWYLKEINENNIIGYHNGSPNSIAWLWYESECSLKYKECEIVYCIMQKLSKYYEQNNKFEIEFNKYKEFFNGTLEDFLECLINENHDFSYRIPLLDTPIKMIEIEGYDGLRKKLIDKLNNLSTPAPKAEAQGNKVLSVKQRNTINRHREYVEFYCKNIKELKSPPIMARRDTWKKFDICKKTLERAFNEHKDILDTYQIVI